MKIVWLLVYFVVLIWSAIDPKDYFTWFLEVFPALVGLAVMAATYNRFRLTPLPTFSFWSTVLYSWSADITPMPRSLFLTG
jgi:uncharacterized membrane protein YjdF